MLFFEQTLKTMLEIIIEMALTSSIMICFVGCLLNILSECFKDCFEECHQEMVPKEDFDRMLEILRNKTLKLKRLRREVRQHHKACRRYRSKKEHLRSYLED